MGDVILSRRVPQGTRQLTDLLRDALCSGRMHPFTGELAAQDGQKLRFESAPTPRELASMGWLAENVEGKIPALEELTDSGRELVSVQGIGRGI